MALEKGLQEVMLLKTVRENRLLYAESATWEKLQSAIWPANADQTLLEGHSKGAMRAVLAFLVSWRSKMTVLRNRIADSLIILLRCPAWRQVAQFPPLELQTQLLKVFARNEAMRLKLVETPETPENMRQKTPEVPDCHTQQLYPVMDEIKNAMILGASAMQKLGWSFPSTNAVSSDRDKAMEGFHTFLLAVSRLGVITQQLEQDAAEEHVGSITQELTELWPNVLRFLGSMCVERRIYTSKIKFVVLTLSELSPSCRFAAEDAHIQNSIESATEALRLNPKDRRNTLGCPQQETCEADLPLVTMRTHLMEIHQKEPLRKQEDKSVVSKRVMNRRKFKRECREEINILGCSIL